MKVFHEIEPKPVPLRLIDRLANFSATGYVFNPWGDQDPLDIQADPAFERRVRLALHLHVNPKLLLIGEAPGYQGCHFSGVPFTNEKMLVDGLVPRIPKCGRITSRPKPFCEPSATIVWGALRALGLAEHVVMWNAFAWHPHKPGLTIDKLHTNRAPNRLELFGGSDVLRSVVEHFSGAAVLPVGRVAEKALKQLKVNCMPAIRHPAMGGATQFRGAMAEVAKRL